MEALDLAVITEAWIRLFELDSLFYLFLGTLIGLVFGVLPGARRNHRAGYIDSVFDEYGTRRCDYFDGWCYGSSPHEWGRDRYPPEYTGNGAQRRHDAGRISHCLNKERRDWPSGLRRRHPVWAESSE